MTFTETATNHLLGYNKSVSYRLELRTEFAESSDWQEYPFTDFRLYRDSRVPATLRAELVNSELELSAERSRSCRTQRHRGRPLPPLRGKR